MYAMYIVFNAGTTIRYAIKHSTRGPQEVLGKIILIKIQIKNKGNYIEIAAVHHSLVVPCMTICIMLNHKLPNGERTN